jgi:hypothetical protein
MSFLVAALLGGCQLVVPADERQCESDGDCDRRGGEFAGSACVGEICVPAGDQCLGRVAPIVEDRFAPLHTRLRFVNIADIPVSGIEVFVCASRDEACDAPVGPPVVTDRDGYAYMTIWKNFRGTFQVKNPPAGSDLMKTKLHVLPPVEVDAKPDLEVPPQAAIHLVPRSLFATQLAARAPLDRNAGHIIAATIDCAFVPRAGVSVLLRTDAKGQPLPFYFSDNRSASFTATETSVEGAFGIANVPEGPVVIEANIPSSGRKFARVELWVNKDTISTFSLVPTFTTP